MNWGAGLDVHTSPGLEVTGVADDDVATDFSADEEHATTTWPRKHAPIRTAMPPSPIGVLRFFVDFVDSPIRVKVPVQSSWLLVFKCFDKQLQQRQQQSTPDGLDTGATISPMWRRRLHPVWLTRRGTGSLSECGGKMMWWTQ